jgi:hypothetical protein
MSDYDPDPTAWNDGPYCDERSDDGGYTCTRRPGHSGRHAAGDYAVLLAVWP